MIDVKDRVPKYPGRVQITDNADGTKDITRADQPTETGTPINRATAQLLQADIRDATIKSGNSITAGTVVDVASGQAYYNTVTTAPVSSTFIKNTGYNLGEIAYAGNDMFLVVSSSTSSIALGVGMFIAAESGLTAYNNGTGNATNLENSSGTVGKTAATLLPVSNTVTLAIFQRTPNKDWIYYSFITRSGTSVTASSKASLVASNVGAFGAALLSTTSMLYVYNDSGLKAAVGTVGSSSITSGTVYSIADNTEASDIKVVSLSSSKALIYYTDTATGYARAVAVSISGTAVTFGTPVTLSTSTVSGVQMHAETSAYATLSYVIGSTAYARVAYVSGTTVTFGTALSLGTGSATAITYANGKYVVSYTNGTNGYLTILTRSTTTLTKASSYTVSGAASMPCLAAWEDNKFVFCYVNASSQSYMMLCRIYNNAVVGTVTDQSKTAIALVGGTSGDTIKVAYSGHVPIDGITAGTTITTDGIMANSPQDGWLEILSEWVVSTIKSLGGG